MSAISSGVRPERRKAWVPLPAGVLMGARMPGPHPGGNGERGAAVSSFILSNRPGASEKAEVMSDLPMARRRRRLWHPGWWLLALALGGCAWLGWREYDYRCAVREAKAAGWQWDRRDPFTLILADWRVTGSKKTWTERYRSVELPYGTDLAAARPLLGRLHPTNLSAPGSPNTNLDALRWLPALQRLDLSGCIGLQNVDALRGLPVLQTLYLDGCTALQNVDGLSGLPALQTLTLTDCAGLQNVDALRGLSMLQSLGLQRCTGLQNADGLRGLPALQWLYLIGCPALTPSALRELRAALPGTSILFPDGTDAPPP